jgi:protein kinase-like protein/putative zinc finger protein
MACPVPEQLSRFVEHRLDEAARFALEEHLDECDDCRQTVAVLHKTRRTTERASAQASPELAVTATPEALAATAAAGTVGAVADRARGDLAPGTQLDRYVVDKVLGTGGMGIVYAARDPGLDRAVAIKVLRQDFARRDPDAARRIVHEARVMARISDPNVLGVFEVGTVDDQVYIAMEIASGGSLRGWLDARQRSIGEILEVFVAAGRGLVAAHDAGVVHRDFKPDNVLIGSDGRIRVTDFGLAHEPVAATGDDAASPAIAGTPAYMAPEQFEGGSVDARTDQFSFCVALYEALYGKRPFAGTTLEGLAESVTHGEVQPPPPKHRVPASIRAILLRGLSVVPGDRFPTLADLLKALGRDRGRWPRATALSAAIALIAVGIGFGADWIVRDRSSAVTRTSFAATRAQVEKLVAMRTDAFVAESNLLGSLPALQTIAATFDQADFGLGDPDEDRARLEHIHKTLRSATWVRFVAARTGDELAIADGKGRLLYASTARDAWGEPITGVPAIAAAYRASAETSIAVLRAGDPAVVEARLLGDRPAGLYVALARVKLENDQPRLLFVQLVPSANLLGDVRVAGDVELSIVAPDGSVEGSVPEAVWRNASSNGIAEVIAGERWLVQRAPLGAPGQRAGVAEIVLARRADVGLAGLFPAARLVLAILAVVLAAGAVAGAWLARARDLARATGGARTL